MTHISFSPLGHTAGHLPAPANSATTSIHPKIPALFLGLKTIVGPTHLATGDYSLTSSRLSAPPFPVSPSSIMGSKKMDFDEWHKKIITLCSQAEAHYTAILLHEFTQLIHDYPQFINRQGPGNLDETPLHAVAKSDSPVKLLHVLLDSGADVTVKDDWGNTPLMWAVANAENHLAMVLAKHPPRTSAAAYLNIQCNEQRNTALHLAIGKGYKEHSADGQRLACTNDQLVRLFVDLGADVRIPNRQGNTPLHLACIHRNSAMIHYLLEHGADPLARNSSGKTPGDLLSLSYKEASDILESTVFVYLLNQAEFEANRGAALEAYNRFLHPNSPPSAAHAGQ